MSLRRSFFSRFVKQANGAISTPYLPGALKIPEELTRKIFQLLALDACHLQVGGGHIQEAGWGTEAFTEYLHCRRASNISLCRLVLVCRLWCSIGSEFLYSSPLLATQSQLHLFTRTIQKSSALAQFVKGMIVLDMRPTKHTVDFFSRDSRTQCPEKMFADIFILLSTCPSLQGADFWMKPSIKQPNGKHSVDPYSFLTSNLRQFALGGDPLFAMSYKFQSPKIKLLRLQNHPPDDTPSPPLLPRFYANHVTEMAPFNLVSLGRPSESLPSQHTIRSITVGPLFGNSSWLSSWRLPQSLESLSVFVKLSVPDFTWDPAIQGIFHCLNRSTGNRSSVLRRVDVFLDPRLLGTGAEIAYFAFDNVRYTCHKAGIKFQIHEEWLEDWVGSDFQHAKGCKCSITI